MLVDLLLPARCVVCRMPGTLACARCVEALPRIRPPLCARCGAPTLWPVRRCAECAGRRIAFATARAAVEYDASVRRLVGDWKERALRGLAALAADLVVQTVPRPRAGVLVPVPADPERGLKRGYAPAARLAVELGRRWELPVEPLVRRVAACGPQRGTSLAARRRNVAGAFAAGGRSPPRAALIDDVYTSGSTASAAASALRRAGAREVEVVTFARAIRRG